VRPGRPVFPEPEEPPLESKTADKQPSRLLKDYSYLPGELVQIGVITALVMGGLVAARLLLR